VSIQRDRAVAATARKHVLYQYASAHDIWSEQEQLLALEDRNIEAAAARTYAQIVLRAWLAEQDNPEVEACPN